MHQAHPQTLGLSLNGSILQNVLPPDRCIVGFWQSTSCLNVTFPKRPFPLNFSLQHLPLSVLILVLINDQVITECPCLPTCISLTQTARTCLSSIVTLHHQDRPINNCWLNQCPFWSFSNRVIFSSQPTISQQHAKFRGSSASHCFICHSISHLQSWASYNHFILVIILVFSFSSCLGTLWSWLRKIHP